MIKQIPLLLIFLPLFPLLCVSWPVYQTASLHMKVVQNMESIDYDLLAVSDRQSDRPTQSVKFHKYFHYVLSSEIVNI